MSVKKTLPKSANILADETDKGSLKVECFSKRLDRYANAKNHALHMSNYISLNHVNDISLAQTLENCGTYLVFTEYYTINEIRLTKSYFCKKHLLCQLCAIRRGAKMLSRYLDRYKELLLSKPLNKAYMVTLTVKDGSDLKERFDHLQKSVKHLIKKRHYNGDSVMNDVTGAVWSYEFKRGKNSKEWHPHCHGVWLSPCKPDQYQLSKEWHEITKDSFIVDVREITPDNPVLGFLEVFKYAIKFSSQPPKDTYHASLELKNKRLISSFGDFYGISAPDDLNDDPLEGLPFVEHFYQYISGSYRSYKKPDYLKH
jgi:plasmid rolling circle replication initiator protein Rep